MKKVTFLILLIPIFLSLDIQDVISREVPNETEIKNEVFNNVSEDYANCAAYFSLVSEDLRKNGDNEKAISYENSRDISLNYAFIAAQEGRTDEMAKKVAISKTELSMKSLMKEIDNDLGNISILINHYDDNCKTIMESPEKTIEVWKERISKKYNLDKLR